ncbi:Uncharacterised protein [Enterobacter hormaechei]|nr:Uncharacterised protein [Enterobacter hormaechei]
MDENFINYLWMSVLIFDFTLNRSFRTEGDFISSIFRSFNILNSVFAFELHTLSLN